MNKARIDQLKQFLEEDPDDPFNWYALALEYVNTDPHQAQELFNKLLTGHPTYLPTYYHAGKLAIELNNREMATRIFEKGLAEAAHQQDTKALNELRAILDELLFD